MAILIRADTPIGWILSSRRLSKRGRRRSDRYAAACHSGAMKIYWIDFTSRPKRGKPITCLECVLDGNRLQAGELAEWRSFKAFEVALHRPGPWIAGIDFPFA